MLMGSTILKAESPLYSHFYHLLQPYVHYVPFMRDNASDILQAVRWLRANDEKARDIAREARHFATHYLTRSARLCYWREVVTRLAALMRCGVGFLTGVLSAASLLHRPRSDPPARPSRPLSAAHRLYVSSHPAVHIWPARTQVLAILRGARRVHTAGRRTA